MTIKTLQQFNQVIVNMRKHFYDKKLVITEIKYFHFHFDLPKNVEKNLKHEVGFIISHIESLVKCKIKK